LPRVGQTGLNDNDDVVEGIIVMRKGENAEEVLKRVKEKINELNTQILPSDVKMESFYDRDVLMTFTTHTVMHNVLEGIILVTVIVFLFMANWRTTVIVSIIVPLALLFAFLCLKMKGMSANLLSLGAVDFGIIIDGAVVMVEGLFVTMDHLQRKVGEEKYSKLAKGGIIKRAGGELGKAIFTSKMIIIIALIPIFSFEKVEGKMFSPLAWTLGFALLGALLFTLTLVPVLFHLLFNKSVVEKPNPFVNFWRGLIARASYVTYHHKKISMSIAVVVLVVTLFSAKFLGTEFIPQLNEGAMWITAKFPMSQSLKETVSRVKIMRKDILEIKEVNGVLSQTGRSNDGTDPCGFYFTQMQVNLKPKDEWTRSISYNDLVAEIDQKLEKYQGVNFNYSQPISDNVSEAVAGFKAANGVKIFGDDLYKLDKLANQVVAKMKDVPGVKDLGVIRNIGQPEVTVLLDREKMATYGVSAEDAQTVLEMAYGGKTATEKYEGERKFEIRIRFQKEYRKNEEDIASLKVPTISGDKILLKQICTIEKHNGPAFIYRANTKRYIGVKFSVRDRDLGSTITDAQSRVSTIKLPQGYTVGWVGEFENQVRASNRLALVVPISLLAIFVILFIMFGNLKDAALVIANVPFVLVGGIIALHITGVNFGISAGVGFIALFGICIQDGVLLITQFHKNLTVGYNLDHSIIEAVKLRTRPVVMTALMASVGLMPAAISSGIGSESSKPLAIVIIGGLISATILTLLIFPIIFWFFNRKKYNATQP
jgi:heavy metal efflux system protein